MSLETWIAEYFPVPADSADVQANDISRIKHSLRKWRGLLPENLKKHGLELSDHDLVIADGPVSTPPVFEEIISGSTCALCEKHYESTGLDDEDKYVDACFTCPLYQQGDGCEGLASPWRRAREDGKIQDMVDALDKALDRVGGEAADAKYVAQMLEGAESDDERNAILKENYG